MGHPTYGSPSYEYHGDAEYPTHPGQPGYGSPGDAGPPPYPGSPSYGHMSRPLYPPEAGSDFGYPEYGCPAIMLRRTGPLATRMASIRLAEPLSPRTSCPLEMMLTG